jgi:hypothetical protein
MTRKILPLYESTVLTTGVYLLIIHADKIPPHLGIMIDGKFYSQKVNGKDLGVDYKKLLKIIQKKNIPTLFYALNSVSKKSIKTVFEYIPSEIKNKQTCLNPINRALTEGEDFQIVSELISYLEENNQVEEVYGLNLPNSFVAIPSYSREDVEKRIAFLRDDKRR